VGEVVMASTGVVVAAGGGGGTGGTGGAWQAIKASKATVAPPIRFLTAFSSSTERAL
jgi:hypothetical protein